MIIYIRITLGVYYSESSYPQIAVFGEALTFVFNSAGNLSVSQSLRATVYTHQCVFSSMIPSVAHACYLIHYSGHLEVTY